jgi:hypothetical protein
MIEMIPPPETGNWKLEAGNWKLKAGSWKLEAILFSKTSSPT